MIEDDSALRFCGNLRRCGKGHGFLGLHQRVDSLDRRERGLERGVLGGDFAQRHEELLGVLNEGDQSAEGDRAANHAAASDPDNYSDSDCADCLDRGELARFIDVAHHLRVAGADVERVEFAAAFTLAGEKLHDIHAGERFGKVGVERGETIANLAIDDTRLSGEKINDEYERRNRAQRP